MHFLFDFFQRITYFSYLFVFISFLVFSTNKVDLYYKSCENSLVVRCRISFLIQLHRCCFLDRKQKIFTWVCLCKYTTCHKTWTTWLNVSFCVWRWENEQSALNVLTKKKFILDVCNKDKLCSKCFLIFFSYHWRISCSSIVKASPKLTFQIFVRLTQA